MKCYPACQASVFTFIEIQSDIQNTNSGFRNNEGFTTVSSRTVLTENCNYIFSKQSSTMRATRLQRPDRWRCKILEAEDLLQYKHLRTAHDPLCSCPSPLCPLRRDCPPWLLLLRGCYLTSLTRRLVLLSSCFPLVSTRNFPSIEMDQVPPGE